jgi:hypothetical protein
MATRISEYEEHKRAVAEALRDLDRTLDALVQALSHGPDILVEVEGATGSKVAVRRVCDAYLALDHGDTNADPEADDDEDEEGRKPTRGVLGVVGVNAHVLARAQDVNAAKEQLQAQCTRIKLRHLRVPVPDARGRTVVKVLPMARVILREIGRPSLSLLAAYRKIPILTGRPRRVAYTWSHTRAVYRKSRDDLMGLLEDVAPAAEADRLRLRSLPPAETHLAWLREHYTHMRANVWFDGVDKRNRGRAQLVARLPLLYPAGRSRTLPQIEYPDTDPQPQREREGKLEPKRFLETLPVYRYLPTGRHAARR